MEKSLNILLGVAVVCVFCVVMLAITSSQKYLNFFGLVGLVVIVYMSGSYICDLIYGKEHKKRVEQNRWNRTVSQAFGFGFFINNINIERINEE